MLGLVIGMGVLILAGTAVLIGVVVHRLSTGHAVVTAAQVTAAGTPILGMPAGAEVLLHEPAGTRIVSVMRQSDTLLSLLLSGGGGDRVLVWDVAGNRRVSELRLAP